MCNSSDSDLTDLDVACDHANVWDDHAHAHVPSGRVVLAGGPALQTDWLKLPTATPSAGDLAVTTVTYGIASFQQPHSGDTTLPHINRGELVLNTFFTDNKIVH